MADPSFLDHLSTELETLKREGLYKAERIIVTQQSADIEVSTGERVLNFCANNYLGLSNHPALIEAASEAVRKYGFGMSSVRFICGTQDVHKELERRLSGFLGTDDTILYGSCFDANGGLFEALLGPEDAIVSDALNHASIIDGVRLCKAKRFRFANSDMDDLRKKVKEARDGGAQRVMIATDGVFSMDGYVANLKGVCDIADELDAMTMVDDSHAVGFMGERGRGTHEYCGVMGRVDVITGTLGKALGGASGGYTAGRAQIVEMLRQRSRPYLFSNTLAPVIASTSIAVLDLLESDDELRVKLRDNSARFRAGMADLGFDLLQGDHPIIPVMLGDAKVASDMADRLLAEGIYVIGFSYPVVPRGAARIRTQMSAGHEPEHIDRAIAAFGKVGKSMGLIS